MSDRERGSATVWVLALAGVLAVVGAGAVLVAAAVTARHRAGSAADLTQANGARLATCTVEEGGVVAVTVVVPVRLGPLGLHDATGRARAGPAGG